MAKIKPAKGKAFSPKLGGGVSSAPLPLLPPNRPFLLLAHPKRWTVMFDSKGVGHLIPQLRQLTLKGGSNGVQDRLLADGSISYDPDAAISTARQAGWQYIDPQKVGVYVEEHDVRGGKAYVHICTRVFPGSEHQEPDVDAYTAWCAKLLKAEHIAEPPVYVLEEMLSRYERQVVDASSKRSPAGDRKAAGLEKVVQVLRAEVAIAKGQTPPDAAVEEDADELAELRARLAEAEAEAEKAKAEAKAAKAKATKAEKAKAAAEAKAAGDES